MNTTTPTPAAAETSNTGCQPAMSPIAHRPELTVKIARLPKPTRDLLNVMLDDGLPYHVILDEVGEAAQGLTPSSLAQWVKGRYQDYLKERQTIEDVKTQGEFAADLLRELGNVDPSVVHRACLVVANLQLFHAIEESGAQALEDMLRANPSSYLSILNTLCNMVQPQIDLENHRLAREEAGAKARAASDNLPK